MPGQTKCLSLVKGRRIRVTKLDGCGRPVFGECSQAVSKGFISVAFTANTLDTDEINVTNAAGERCVYEPAETSLTGYTLEIQFCEVDPELFSLVTGQPVTFDAGGTNVNGFDIDTQTSLTAGGFALELWAGAANTDACATEGAQGAFGYLLIPFLKGGIVGDFTVENGAVTFTLTGASTRDGNSWGFGPYNDIMLTTGVNEVQTVTITGSPTGGDFTLTYAGQETGDIVYNALGSAVETALEALPNVGSGNVSVSGGAGGPYVITFQGSLGGRDVVTLVATPDFTGGTAPSAAVTVTTPGASPVPGRMSSAVSSTLALRTMIVDVAPPAAACGCRPLLDPSVEALESISGVTAGRTVTFTPDPADIIAPVWYDFGDGTWDYLAPGAMGATSHTYAQAGTYTVRASSNGTWVTTTVTVS